MGSGEYICEVCGNPTKRKEVRIIEGVEMIVCPSCSQYGERPKSSRPKSRRPRKKRKAPPVYYGDAPKKKSKRPRRRNKIGQTSSRRSYRKRKPKIEDLELVTDYREKLRKLRQKLQMRVDEFANSVKIAESTYRNIENKKLEMTIPDAMKIEKEYEIKLTQEPSDDDDFDLNQFQSGSGGYTLGDVFFKRKK